MKKYFNKILLILSCVSLNFLHASSPRDVNELMLPLAHAHFDNLYVKNFSHFLLNVKGYEPVDSDGVYRKKLLEIIADNADLAEDSVSLALLDGDEFEEKNTQELKHFLSLCNLYHGGVIDESHPEVLKAKITRILFMLDKAFYGGGFLSEPLFESIHYFDFYMDELFDLVATDIPALLHPVYVELHQRLIGTYIHLATTPVVNNVDLLKAFSNRMPSKARSLTVMYVDNINLLLDDFLRLTKSFNPMSTVNLSRNKSILFNDMSIYERTIFCYDSFLHIPEYGPEELSRLRRALLEHSVDILRMFGDASTEKSAAKAHLVDPYQTKHNSELLQIPDVPIILHSIAYDFCKTWIFHLRQDIMPTSCVDLLYGMALTTYLDQEDYKFPLEEHMSWNEIKQNFVQYLQALEAVDLLQHNMLNVIKMRSAALENLYGQGSIKETLQGHIAAAGGQVKVVHAPNRLKLDEVINAFFKRIEDKKKAEEAALKTKNQGRAINLYQERYQSIFMITMDYLREFASGYPLMQNDVIMASMLRLNVPGDGNPELRRYKRLFDLCLSNKNYNALQELLPLIRKAELRLFGILKGLIAIDIHALKDLTGLSKSLEETLKALAKDLDRMQREDEISQRELTKKEAKAEKKRLKAEAKAQEKAERAKQKAEEKAKRESIKRLSVKSLAPSPDPSPYPPVAEKRLSVKAEIAEKHRSATLRLVEKEQRKSLRQSVKDLLHIGEADRQKDKRDSKRFSQRSSKRKSEVLDETPEAPLDLSQFGAVDRASIDKETLEIWEGKRLVTHQDSVVAILDQLNGATSLQEIIDGFTKGNNFKPLNASSKLKDFKFFKKEQVYSIRVHGKADKHRICFIWDDKEKKARKVQYGTYH